MSALLWDDDMRLGYEPMDETHREFADVVHALQTCAEAARPAALQRVIEHLRSHFDEEDALMREHDFPPRDCHIDEHAAVLQSAEDVAALVAAGDSSAVPSFAQALADWFPGHAVHLDSALAHWMVKRQYGGKPVVFRRRVEQHA
ncbi:bacteriohemerythrin [Pelomonas sp. KK5]|uniref:bacteriohemerythrin n=1 Tax=Pelomonas sp. KK5 TaxID=1855730 RepID=UPI00097C87E2|nr:hemerythrin family protein [Pelomonas sp. KK5]